MEQGWRGLVSWNLCHILPQLIIHPVCLFVLRHFPFRLKKFHFLYNRDNRARMKVFPLFIYYFFATAVAAAAAVYINYDKHVPIA